MDFNKEIEEDVNLFDVVDSKELVDEEDIPRETEEELNFESASLDGYAEMVEAEDEESDILE